MHACLYCEQGYKQKDAYIATQGPLKNTVEDLWKMMWEYQCGCIVMLCQLMEDGQVLVIYNLQRQKACYFFRRAATATGQERWGRRWCVEG